MVKAIVKQDNVYVVIEIDDETFEKNYEEYKNNENFIWGSTCTWNPNKTIKRVLYGDRVCVDERNYLSIDGERIINLGRSYSSFSDNFNIKEIVAFLNQIENLGLDAFLDNYKLQLQNFKKELEFSFYIVPVR